MKRIDVIYRYSLLLTKKLSDKQLMVLLAVATGLIAGFATYIFEFLLYSIRTLLVSWFPVGSASLLYLIYPAIGIILASLFVRYVIKDNISEGVTRVLYAMSKRGSKIKPHNCYSSIVGGATTIGFGGSVGPEAPIVLTGAAIGSNIASVMRMNYRNTTLLLCCGAGAAVAAIFKAPITGVIFVLEILMLDITVSSIIPLLVATVTATTVVFFLKGFDPILAVRAVDSFDLGNIPMYIVLGLACGVASYYFTFVNSWIAERFEATKSLYKKWLVGGVLLGVLIFIFPPLYGEGYEGFTDLMHGNIEALFSSSMFYEYRSVAWVVVLYLLAIIIFKVIAMSATNAAGGVGGTFAPSLFVGAFTGGLIAFVSNTYFGMNLPILSFTLVGMAGVMSGVMKAPLTSIFLIAELSNGYGLFIPLMVVSSTSFVIGYYLEPSSIYTKKLAKRGELLTHNKDKSVMVFLDLSKLIETDFHPINESSTLGDVVKLIANARRNIFPVLDVDGVLLGVVQLDDLRSDMFHTSKYNRSIFDYMIPPPDTIMDNEQITSVIDRFEQSKAWMLPVVDKHMHYQGFVSKSRILAAYREQLVEMSH